MQGRREGAFQLTLSPNPVRDVLAIGLGVPEASVVEVRIYNAQMVEVVGIQGGWLAEGRHVLGVEMEGLATGVYFVRVEIGDKVLGGKVLKE